ncbi:hypothetical protein, partial [Rhizobium leguminosarum]|uniref:hypothetical protein n=1 Tax=Rhizobium leguminosarum TaxID=384 RepID=UPI003F98B49A
MPEIASGEIDTEAKKQKLLNAYAEELKSKYPEWANLQVSVVSGAGFVVFCPTASALPSCGPLKRRQLLDPLPDTTKPARGGLLRI